jgi:hypothetical protein
MSSRQTYGCLGIFAELAAGAWNLLRAAAEEVWSAVILEAWDRWKRRR